MKSFRELREKAVSQQQQKLMGLALAYKRGEISADEISPQAKAMADKMSEKDLEDFAKTKHKGLPVTKESIEEEKSVRQLIDPKKEVMVVKMMSGKRHKVVVIDKSKEKEYLAKGWLLAEESNLEEGTWALPDSPKAKDALKKLMSKPIKLGKEGDDASDKLYALIGDDELFDDLYVAGKKNPNGDARPIITKWMKKNFVGNWSKYAIEEQKDDAEYNDEGGMAISQLKTAKSAVEELMSIIKDDDNLPEWVQSKLTKAVDYMDSVRDYMASEKGEVQEAVKTTHVVIDTADGNKVVATASSEQDAKSSVASAERPPMNIKNKKTLKIVKLKKPVGDKQVDRMVGYPLKEAVSPAQQAAIAIAKKEKGEEPKKEGARADAMRAMRSGGTKGMATTKKDKDTEASDDDRKAASKNIIAQLRKAADLSTGAEIEFERGKGKVTRDQAQSALAKFNALAKPFEKERFQNSIKSLADIKKILGR